MATKAQQASKQAAQKAAAKSASTKAKQQSAGSKATQRSAAQAPANPFWSQAAGKSWDPGTQPVSKGQPLPSGATTSTSSTSAGAPKPPATPAAPYLTPTQQLDQINFDSGIDGQIQTLSDGIRDAGINTHQALVDAQQAHDVNTESANESAAARGLFQSSIRAGDLNDIDATLTTRQNTLNTALWNLTISNNSQIGRLTTQRSEGDSAFLGMAVQNAQAQVPVVPPASSSTHTTPAPTALPTPNDWTPQTSGVGALEEPANPFWSQAAGKPWNPQQSSQAVKPPNFQATPNAPSLLGKASQIVKGAKPPGKSQGGFSSTIKPAKGMGA